MYAAELDVFRTLLALEHAREEAALASRTRRQFSREDFADFVFVEERVRVDGCALESRDGWRRYGR
jgi:hypothetical protein